ncbi:MAG: RNA polymerase sigma factor [Crocinitomicaceae bacterium]
MIKEKEFIALIKPHKGILVKVSKIYMDTQSDQEDMQQEILFQLWKSYPNFKGNSQFSSWMYRVSVNTAITFFKQKKKRPFSVLLTEKQYEKAEEIDTTKNEQLDHFYRAVRTLNEIEKALILYSVEGYSQKEIAKQLGLSEVNTRVKLKRTKDKLRTIIKTQGYEF